MLINNDLKLSIELHFLRTWNSSQPILTSDTFKTPPTQHKPLPVIIHPSHSPYTPPTHHEPLGGAPSHTLFVSRGASPYKDQQPARGPWRCLSPSRLSKLPETKQTADRSSSTAHNPSSGLCPPKLDDPVCSCRRGRDRKCLLHTLSCSPSFRRWSSYHVSAP